MYNRTDEKIALPNRIGQDQGSHYIAKQRYLIIIAEKTTNIYLLPNKVHLFLHAVYIDDMHVGISQI